MKLLSYLKPTDCPGSKARLHHPAYLDTITMFPQRISVQNLCCCVYSWESLLATRMVSIFAYIHLLTILISTLGRDRHLVSALWQIPPKQSFLGCPPYHVIYCCIYGIPTYLHTCPTDTLSSHRPIWSRSDRLDVWLRRPLLQTGKCEI